MKVMAILTASLFFLLALLHIYWAAGGTRGLKAALPQTADGDPVIPFARGWKAVIPTSIVAISLLFLTEITLEAGGWLIAIGSNTKLIASGAAALFMLRVIGDFRYVGMFKKVKTTHFSLWDSRLFIPLCLYFSISLFLISL